MPKICYIKKKFSTAHREIIDRANVIIQDFQAQGYTLTLRQLYYQFVSRDWMANKQQNYKMLGVIISAARCAGEIDWDAIEDRTRFLRKASTWNSPSDIVRSCAAQFDVDLWAGQDYRPEVWIEKDALVGVLERICDEFQVPYFSCRGYTSDSEIWGAARRHRNWVKTTGQAPIIFHLGDHDPSGIDMTRDIADRLKLFSGLAVPPRVKRIALNMDQIEEYDPPPNPAKTTDARYKGYSETHGEESWELDALSPTTISDLISNELNAILNGDLWDAKIAERDRGREQLRNVSENWEFVLDQLREND